MPYYSVVVATTYDAFLMYWYVYKSNHPLNYILCLLSQAQQRVHVCLLACTPSLPPYGYRKHASHLIHQYYAKKTNL
jgi:hypothetical protein